MRHRLFQRDHGAGGVDRAGIVGGGGLEQNELNRQCTDLIVSFPFYRPANRNLSLSNSLTDTYIACASFARSTVIRGSRYRLARPDLAGGQSRFSPPWPSRTVSRRCTSGSSDRRTSSSPRRTPAPTTESTRSSGHRSGPDVGLRAAPAAARDTRRRARHQLHQDPAQFFVRRGPQAALKPTDVLCPDAIRAASRARSGHPKGGRVATEAEP